MSRWTEYLLWGFLLFSVIFLGGEIIAGFIIDTAFYKDCQLDNGVAVKGLNNKNICIKSTSVVNI